MVEQVYHELDIGKLLALYEVFKMVRRVKGCVVECGVAGGGSFLAWVEMSQILEPRNFSRRIVGFDTWAGFPVIAPEDENAVKQHAVGDEALGDFDTLKAMVQKQGAVMFGSPDNQPRVELVQGDIAHTVPQYVALHRELMVALLYIDVDLYEPTKVALQHFVPRMPKGALLVMDELDFRKWPGETHALLECANLNNLEFRQFPWQGQIAYARIGY